MNFGRNDYNEIFANIESKIPEDEPVFLFRGTDPLVPRLLLNYATEMRLTGVDPRVADSVVAHAQRIMDWQKKHPVKHADLIHESEVRIREKARISELIESLEVDGYLPDDKLSELDELTESILGSGRYLLLLPSENCDLSDDNIKSKYDLIIKINSLSDMKILWITDKLN